MYEHWKRFTSVLPVSEYENVNHLKANIEESIITPIEKREKDRDEVAALKKKVKELEAELGRT